MVKYVLIFVFAFFWVPDPPDCDVLDIVVLADISGSIEHHEHEVADAMEGFVDRFDLSDGGVRIGIFLFNDEVFELNHLTSDRSEIQNSINLVKIIIAHGNTHTQDALFHSAQALMERYRPNAKRVIVLISDGSPNNPGQTAQVAKEVRLMGIRLCGIYIDDLYGVEAFMQEICDPYCYVKTSFAQLPEKLKKLNICM